MDKLMETDAYKVLIEQIGLIRELSDSEEDLLREYFIPQKFKAGDHITEYGKVSDCVGLVCSGFCRVYVIDLDGNEITIHMAEKGEFVGAISSFLTRSPSEEYVQVVTEGELLTISYNRLEELYGLSATWEHIGRKIMEHLFLTKQRRVTAFVKHTAEKRYQYLMEKHPEMLLNVPGQYIASYLGIKPETLSRIRAKIV